MKRKIIFYGFLVLLLLILLLPACTKTTPAKTIAPAKTTASATTIAPATTTTPAATTETPQYGGVFKILSGITFVNLGFVPGDAADMMYARPAIENLVTLDPKGTGTIIPQLATGWIISPDFTSITFSLRKGVKFHDGTDFNAAAAKYCLDLFRQSPRTELKAVTSVDIVDDYTIRLNLSSYDPAFFMNLNRSRAGMMVSPTALKTMSKEEAMNHPVGTGPYKFVSYQRGISLKYERFDNYWGGKPYLDGIEWDFVADPMTQIMSLKAGEGQALRQPSAKDTLDLKATGKFNASTIATACIGLIGDSNHPDSPFSNIDVRRAISYAFDRDKMAQAVGFGLYKSTNQYAIPANWYYNPAVVGYPYDPQKAKDLLAKAGYPKGFQTAIEVETFPDLVNMATMAQGFLTAIGIDTKVNQVERAASIQHRTSGWNNGLVVCLASVGPDVDPGATMISYFSNQATNVDPKSAYFPKDYDTALTSATIERDPAKRKAMFQAVEKMMIDDYCIGFPFYVSHGSFVSSQQVHGFDLYTYASSDWNPEKVWLSK